MSQNLPQLLLAVPDPDTDPAWFGVLSADEWTRHDGFRFERDRLLFRTAHALVRHSLSQVSQGQINHIAAADWVFTTGSHGRPEPAPGLADGLRFNLSHAHGLVAVLLHGPHDAGVDVEPCQRDVGFLSIARFSFAPAELEDVAAQTTLDARRQRFFAIWTLKEAYIKARGLGLAMDLSAFAFSFPDALPVRVTFEPRAEDQAERWHFWRDQTETHQIAVANTDPDARPPVVRWIQPGDFSERKNPSSR
ncbi:MAG: 4'-phosphopantetheinyl transferase [Myxococcota bacterium]|jgi:4'-phosphopantetheinyl transferase